MTAIAPRLSATHERITRVVAATLRVPVACVGPLDNFASLGMDSLAAVELTAAIEDELGTTLPLAAVHEYPTVDALCRFLSQAPSDDDARRRRRRADAALPADITPGPRVPVLTRDARNVLLTGATGFLGAYLLRALLDETQAVVHCLVRPSAADAAVRVRRNLARYGLLSTADANRIRVIEGDVTLPPPDIANRVDAIYHAAADVNWVHSYDTLRAANVHGTRELLRLACTGTPKPFHFVSSTSVCHSTTGPRVVDERTDVSESLDGLQLGYAESKCVAEALVREAGRRGLPVTIIRPSLISGDTTSGRSNADDLTSRFIAGCIQLRAAPDLDWRMDCVPVDDAARSIVRLACAHERGAGSWHVTAGQPRHWRELVLWMRLAGYDVELIPYAEWADVLRATNDSDNPLQPLRPFFLQTIAAENHLTLPELFEESRRSRVHGDATAAVLASLGVRVRPLDSALIARYFDDFVGRGVIRDTHLRPTSTGDVRPKPVLFESSDALSQWFDTPVTLLGVSLEPIVSQDSIVAELTSLRGNTPTGLFDANVCVTNRAGRRRQVRLFVKAKPSDAHAIQVAEALGALASPTLGETVRRFRDDLGLTRSHVRELSLYGIEHEGLRRHMPRALLVERDDARGRWLLGLEWIDDASLLDATDASRWSPEAIAAAVDGLAAIHSVGCVDAPWLPPRRDAAKRVEMTPLWAALAAHAHERSAAWSDGRLRHVHERLVNDVSSWARVLDESPRTLIHNDFNPRNIAIRDGSAGPRLCAFDWELATLGAPQRDLAELLCFVLPPNASLATVARWVDRHRVALAKQTGTTISRPAWEAGFSAALCDVLVDRFASYAMIERVRPQRFLSRITRSWLNMFRFFPWTG